MKIGASSYAFRWAIGTQIWQPASPLGPIALLEKAASLGAEAVQICDNLPLDGLSDSELGQLGKRATDLGLALEVGIRGSQPAHVRCYLEIAQQVGARLLRVVLAGPDWEPTFDGAAALLSEIVPELRAAGVALAIENRFSMLPTELACLVHTVDDPLVGVCLDPLNSITRLVGVGETVRVLAPLALSVHAKDAVISRPGAGFYIVGCPLGKGLVNLTGMLETVRAAGCSPNVFVEGWMDPLEDEIATLAQEELWARDGMAYLRRVL